MSPPTILTTEKEHRIANWILTKAKLGFRIMHPEEVKTAVQKVLTVYTRKNKFVDVKPEESGYYYSCEDTPKFLKEMPK